MPRKSDQLENTWTFYTPGQIHTHCLEVLTIFPFDTQGFLCSVSVRHFQNSCRCWFESLTKYILWTQNHWKDNTGEQKPAWSFKTSFWPYFFLLSLFLSCSPLSLSILPSLLSSAFPWLTWSHSSRFIGSGGELGPFWRHFERYRVSSMFFVSLKSTTTTTTDRDHPPWWLGFKFLMITGGRAPCPSTPPSSLPSALSLLDMLLPVFSVVALFITVVPLRSWSIHPSQHWTALPPQMRTSVWTLKMANDPPRPEWKM